VSQSYCISNGTAISLYYFIFRKLTSALELITDLFSIAKNSRGIVKDLQNLKSKARGIKTLILSRQKFNMV
jgi:hypothetical protein